MADEYECDQCGACCRSFLVEIDHVDVVREPRLLPISRLLDGNGKIEFDSEWEKQYSLACFGEQCPMLGAENRCGIYPTRPNVCVMFAAGSDQCQEARETVGLPLLLAKGLQ